ncbi:MAG: bifunctional lysylphosphatidylglycerol flippase/synthetase MprF [Gammaproteobacteria bacterium]
MTDSAIAREAASSWRWLQRTAGIGAGALVFAFAAFAVHRLSGELSLRDLRAAVGNLSWRQLAAALACAAASFVLLYGYDRSALHYLGRRLPAPLVAFTSFCAYAIGNAVGVSLLSGGSIRYRMYLAAGMDGADVARITAFNMLAFGVGVGAVGAVALMLHPEAMAHVTGASAYLLAAAGGAVSAMVAGFVLLCFVRPAPITLGPWRVRLPSGRTALLQLVISAADIAVSGLCLYVLLPGHGVPYTAFLAVYAVATVAGVISHVPGGVGVFETIMLLAFRDHMTVQGLGAALVGYRFVYYLLPLLAAAMLLATRELRSSLQPLAIGLRGAARIGNRFAPLAVAVLAFLSGVVLLWSSATPAVPERLLALQRIMPLFVLEISHVFGAVIGLALLVIARGLFRKLNGAWLLALGLSAAGSAISLAKGIDYEEGLLLLLVTATLWVSRRQFYRRTKLVDAPLSPGWLVALSAALAGAAMLVLFSFKHVEYRNALWWQFGYHAEAARSMRATLAGAAALIAFALVQMLRPARAHPHPPDRAEMARAERIVRSQPGVVAMLALTGDKRLLFADEDGGFVMYGTRGRSWVAMGDPVGPPQVQEDLAWQFRELADREGGRVAFYQTRPQTLPIYVDMGLIPFKLGEEAVIVLPEFSLDGAARKVLRAANSRGARDGLSLEIVGRDRVAAHLEAMRSVSDRWLAAKNTREKRFSIGAFDPGYVGRCDAALVRRGDAVVAFATLMTTDRREEISVDLMRHTNAAPASTMMYLFVQLLLHYKAAGYGRFNLGMAPLSGLEHHPLAPLWHRFGHLLYNRGERFYNFQGLRLFKDKFDPQWEPRYLVTQGGLNPLIVMADVAALIAGGIGGIVAK